MCFISTVIKIKEDEATANAIAEMMLGEQKDNPDGSGAYCFNRGEGEYNERKVFETLTLMKDNLSKFDVVNYHFRKATGGELSTHNVHFWRMGNWVFSHNGVTGSFQSGKDCDSLGLFKTLIKNGSLREDNSIDLKRIKNIVSKVQFWGRLVIINTETKKMYFLGDFRTYLLNRSYLVVTSAVANFEKKKFINALGIIYETEDEIELEELEEKIDGIYSYDFDNGFIQLDTKFKEIYEQGFKKLNIGQKSSSLQAEAEYSNTSMYQEELDTIEEKYNKVVKEVAQDYSTKNIKKLEVAEIEKEIAIGKLDEKYFGVDFMSNFNNELKKEVNL